MKTINVADATNTQLDWLVAKCEGVSWLYETLSDGNPPGATYTTDWSLMGPIIERARIGLLPSGNAYYERDGGTFYSYGLTSLIAAARCYVASKMGEVVDVPEELT